MRGTAERLACGVLFLAAGFAALVALATYEVLCFGETGGASECRDGNPSITMVAQLVLGIAGFTMATGLLVQGLRGRREAARRYLACGLATFAVWAVLVDAATHGWGHGMRLF